MKKALKVLAVDIGGTNVKILATGQTEPHVGAVVESRASGFPSAS
jgi:hypothetical protein